MTPLIPGRAVARPLTVPAASALLVAAAIVPGAAVSIVVARPRPGTVIVVVGLAIAAIAGVVDARTLRIPDAPVVLSAAAALAAVVVRGATWGGVAALVTGAATMALPVIAVHAYSPQMIGFGDVKLAAAPGALVACADPRSALVALMVASGAGVVVAVVAGRRGVAFGPLLVLAAALTWAARAAGMELS